MRRRVIGSVGAAIGVAGALAGCGGSSTPVFTIKANLKGDVAYLVVHTAVPQSAVAPVLLRAIRSVGAVAFTSTGRPATVSLDCNQHTTIGSSGIPAATLHPYTGKDVSIEVYGTGSFADGICSGFLSRATHG